MLQQQSLPFLLQLLFSLLQLSLLPDSGLKLSLLSFGDLLQPPLFLQLLFDSCLLKIFSLLGSDLCLDPILLSGSPLVGLDSSFRPQCIKLSLPV